MCPQVEQRFVEYRFYLTSISIGLLSLVGMLWWAPAFAQPVEQAVGMTLEEMVQVVSKASPASPPWEGPKKGPLGLSDKKVAVIAEDFRNGGILGVAEGVAEAAEALNWQVRLFDAEGTLEGREKAIADALLYAPDGVILDGADALALKEPLAKFSQRGIPIVGWHVSAIAGPMTDSPVSMNISTDPLEVARVTAAAAVAESEGEIGVVIFTDSNFEIALAKSGAMADVIRAWNSGDTLLNR